MLDRSLGCGGERVGQRERAGVERAADDGAGEPRGGEFGHVVGRGDAAGGDDGQSSVAACISRIAATLGPASMPSVAMSV